MAFALPSYLSASQHNHETDMQRLIEFCKIHSKDECLELHAKMHMKHHGGTREDFSRHYEEKHDKENGKTHKDAY